MNNNFDLFNYQNLYHTKSPHSQSRIPIQQTKQYTFYEPNSYSNNHNQTNHKQNQQVHDTRTEDQVMNNLSFSIQDLLSKITKVREEYEVPNKIIIPPKIQQPPSFKLSNLSISTETNSNHSKSDHHIEKYQNQSISSRKRGSEPQKQVFTNSQRNVRIVLTNSQSKSTNNQPTMEMKNLLSSNQSSYSERSQRIERQNSAQNLPFGGVSSNLNTFSQQNYGFGKAHLGTKQIFNKSQNSAFGKAPQFFRQQQKKSIIIENPKQSTQSNYQQLHIEDDKKINSLFDGKIIRQIAASTIFESPTKNKNSMIKMQSPFLDIVGKKDNIVQSKIIQTSKGVSSMNPVIKINGVQNKVNIRQQPQLSIRDFHLGKQLGSGKFGDVYQAIHKKTGTLYAIKKIFKSTILQYNMIEQFTRELKIHYMLDYPNIIKLYTHFDDQYHIFLVMEYGQGGMLMEKLKKGQKFASNIVEQMLRGVQYLQNKKIAHRDIKPQNIVMMFNDTAKLCDFGWSRFFDSDMKKTFCGTLDYVSPQMKDNGEYSLKIDIWSLGVLTFQIICGYAPFKNEINSWRLKGANLNQKWNWNILYPPQVSSVAQSFMRNLLKQNPNQRASIRFCMNHLFIRKYNQMNYDQQEDKRFKQIGSILAD